MRSPAVFIGVLSLVLTPLAAVGRNRIAAVDCGATQTTTVAQLQQ